MLLPSCQAGGFLVFETPGCTAVSEVTSEEVDRLYYQLLHVPCCVVTGAASMLCVRQYYCPLIKDSNALKEPWPVTLSHLSCW